MEMSKVLCMNGGGGETSYASNSFLQKEIIEATRSVVEEALLDLHSAAFPDKLCIADLGCSSGPNVLSVVTGIVDTIEERCRQLCRSPPDFQLFLNDLPANDFNSVFRSLRAFYEKREVSGRGRVLGRCFVAGVPGSFHGRLFHTGSIDLFHSSSSLQWLSQVPPKLQGHDMALNKRNIYISRQSPPSVAGAYSMQFQRDFSDFLRFRSEEMGFGGHMVLIFQGRKTLDPTNEEDIFHWDLLTQVLMDMVEEGYIAEEKVDSFNLSCYLPCGKEVEDEIQREGSFSLKCLQIFAVPWDACQDRGNYVEHRSILPDKMSRGQSMANCIRAVLESLLAGHFGGGIIEDIFLRYSKVLEDDLSRNKRMLTNMVVSLVRKS